MRDWRNAITDEVFAFAASVQSSTNRDQSNAYVPTATEPTTLPLEGLKYASVESVRYPEAQKISNTSRLQQLQG